jgi:hypothetical protein
MKTKQQSQRWLPALAVCLALSGSAYTGFAAEPEIRQSFDENIDGWSINYKTGEASATWNPTAGVDGTGCLQITLTNGGSKVGPLGNVGTYNTASYWKYEFDMMIDPASGTDESGGYGNLQTVMRDASWSWDSHWFGAIDTSYLTWKHISVIIPPLPEKAEDKLGFEVGAASGVYNADLIIYVDNLVITPMQNPWVTHAFTNESEVTTGVAVSGGLATAPTLDTAKDAGGGFTPAGSLKHYVPYDPANTGWQEGTLTFTWSYDSSRYSTFEFDVFIDGTSVGGVISLFLQGTDWSWNNVGSVPVNSAMVGKWTHCSLGLGSVAGKEYRGFILQCGGGALEPITYYFDNLSFAKSVTPPTITKLAPGTPKGLQITMDNDTSQWQRDGFSTPDDMPYMFWYNDVANGPVDYSFTLNDFPDGRVNSGFQAHMFFVNTDTDPSGTGDAQNGSPDWNAADLLALSLNANADGTYTYRMHWKTNLPAANTDHTVASINSPTAIGTWGIRFTDPTNAVMYGPNNLSTNVTLPEDAVVNNFNPGSSFLQYGMFKADGANDGHNNGAHGTISNVKKTGGSFTFDESFPGPTITTNYAWRVTRATAVTLVPDGVGRWLTWTLPADGYNVLVSPSASGPWTVVTNLVETSTSTKRSGAVPAASIPAGNTAFFRLGR